MDPRNLLARLAGVDRPQPSAPADATRVAMPGLAEAEAEALLRRRLMPERPEDVPAELVEEAKRMLEREEAFRSRAYRDYAGVPTIGYGRTGRDVRMGMSTSREQEDPWLDDRIRREAAWLSTRADVQPHPELISAVYNLGHTGFLRTGAHKAIHADDYDAAGDSLIQNGRFAKNKKTGKMEPVLEPRRRREAALLAGRDDK